MRRSAMKRTPRKKTPQYTAYKNQPDLPDEILAQLGVRLLQNGVYRIEDMRNEPAAAVHHIFCGCRTRPDYWSNFCGVNFAGHTGVHDGTRGEPVTTTILALMAKHKKSIVHNSPREFSYFELRAAYGKNLLPCIEAASFEDSLLEAGRRQLLAVIAEIESTQLSTHAQRGE